MSNKESKYNLSKLNKPNSQNAGFQIPSMYLEELESRILLNVKEVSKLDKQGFTIPENYFENVEDKIVKKVKKSQRSSLFYLKKGMVAAIVLLMITIGIRYFTTNSSNIEINDMNAWMENGIVDVSDYELASIYEDELQQVAITDFVDQTEIENYLINNVNDLLEEQE